MKRILIAGVALALMAVMATSLSAADRKGMIGVGVGGGALLPMGDFGDESKLGWRAGVGAGYFVTNEIAIGATGAFSNNKASDDLLTALQVIDSTITDAKTQIIEFGAWGKYFFKMQSDKVAPYVKAGVGGYNAKAKVESGSGSASASETNLGINGGVGAMFSVSPTASIFVEGAFHNIFSDPSANYITATAGVAFMFGGSSSTGGGNTE